jgi:uncharacterized protein YegP (UPF0339 family)
MKPENTPREARRVAELAVDYERKGYVVTIPRGPSDTPAFLRDLNYTPDLIARSNDETLVVEVKSRETTAALAELTNIAERINERKGWQFVLAFTNPGPVYFIVHSTRGGFMFNLVAANHQVVLTSETYATKEGAINGIAAVRRSAPDNKRYERRVAKDGSAYFVLTSANRQVIGLSEMYASTSAMENGVAFVKANVGAATVKDATPNRTPSSSSTTTAQRGRATGGYFELKSATSGKFSFNLKAANHQVILTSEMYSSRPAAAAGVESVRRNAPDDVRYERKVAKDGSPYFLLTATNGQTIGTSEMYSSASAMENGVASVKANAPSATVKDLT